MTSRHHRRSKNTTETVSPDCDCGCGGKGERVAREDVVSYLESHHTDDDHDAMRDCLSREARGDAAGALQSFRRSLHVPGLPHEVMLETLELLGDAAPPWAIARWVRAQAWMRLLATGSPVVDEAVKLTLVTCFDISRMKRRALRELGTTVAASNFVAEEIGLFNRRQLSGFVKNELAPEVHRRAPDLRSWADEPLKVYRYEAAHGHWLTVRDVRLDVRRIAYDVGSLDGSSLGDHVLGRVVPDGGGGEIFDARPVPIDPETASRIADDDSEGIASVPAWTRHVFEARVDGRLPDGFGRRESHMLSDRRVGPADRGSRFPGLVRLLKWAPLHAKDG